MFGMTLWRNPNFLKFWLALSTSYVGTQISALAFPLTAVLVLNAGAVDMSRLRATSLAASFVLGPFAGVIADRAHRRRILISADLGSALLALTIPIAFFFGVLSLTQLFIVQFFAGAFAIFSEVALMAYLPELVRRDQLVQANSNLQAGSAAISIAGPGLAGVLIQLLSAPIAILVDAISFVLSAVVTMTIKPTAPTPAALHPRASVWEDIKEGLVFVHTHATLRPLAQAILLHFVFANVIYTLLVLFAVRELHLPPGAIGIVYAALGPGFLVGAMLAPRVAERFGAGRTMTYAPLITIVGMSLIPLARGPQSYAVAILCAAHFLGAVGIQLHGVNMVGMRQQLTPDRLQGRMAASFRYVNLLGGAIGALMAGALAERIGLRGTLLFGACGLILPFVRLFFSPIRRL